MADSVNVLEMAAWHNPQAAHVLCDTVETHEHSRLSYSIATPSRRQIQVTR